MTQRVLVTGGAGYVGSVLCEHLLAAGFQVTVLDNVHFAQKSLLHLCHHDKFRFVFGDVRDEKLVPKLVQEADVILPLAAVVGAPACDRDPWLAKGINYDAVKLICDHKSPSQLIILPMTNSGYGSKSGDGFCTEETPLEPISLYGRTKVDAERLVLDQQGISLRLATVFGASPRMRLDLLVNHFTYMAHTEGFIVIFEKDFRRNFVHVRDVADCFVYCIQHRGKMAGRPYNLGIDSANMSKAQLAEKIKEHLPKFYIHYAEVGSDPDKRDYIVSNQRLREAGFEAKRTIDFGIKELLKVYEMLKRSDLKNV